MSIRTAVDLARRRLANAGIPDAEAALDARLLAQSLLGWDGARFVTAAGESLPPDAVDFAPRYEALVGRRERREPLAYITGEREFWNLTFEVSPAVLIPRPETELIVEATLELFPDKTTPLLLADACTGSGCLAVALAHEYPHAHVVATDISREAMFTAHRNAVRHGVAGRIELVETDLLLSTCQIFDLIVANPPYVPERDRPALQPEVRDYEPAVALFAGEDGLLIIDRLLKEAASRLAAGALLLFEFGFGQAAAVEELISNTPGLTMVGLRRDLQGIPRVAIARRTALTTEDTEDTTDQIGFS